MHQSTDVLVLTVIPTELAAARLAFGIDETKPNREQDGTIVYRGQLHSAQTQRMYQVALRYIGWPGNNDAAAVAGAAIERFRPRLVALMGIAAGIRNKIRIGEVVLTERVVAYEPGVWHAVDGESRQEQRPEITRIPYRLQQDIGDYLSRFDAARLTHTFQAAGGSFPTALPGQDQEFFSQHVLSKQLSVRTGTAASGEKLLRDADKLLALRTIHGKIELAEMEGTGIVDACQQANIPWLIVRRISDFCDRFKDDRFHPFAALAAGCALADFLSHGLYLEPAETQQHTQPSSPIAPQGTPTTTYNTTIKEAGQVVIGSSATITNNYGHSKRE